MAVRPHDHSPPLVYKASDRPGVVLFEPRLFWHTPDFSRSGAVTDPQRIPPGTSTIRCVWATHANAVPLYFAPHHCPRLAIRPWDQAPALPLLHRHFPTLNQNKSNLIVFLRLDYDRLRNFEFSVYAFDTDAFMKLPSGEFIANCPVAPVSEESVHDGHQALVDRGWHVEFIDELADLRALRDRLVATGAQGLDAEKL